MQIQCLNKSGFCSKAVSFPFLSQPSLSSAQHFLHIFPYHSVISLFIQILIAQLLTTDNLFSDHLLAKQVLPNTELGTYDKMVKEKRHNF